MIPIYICEDDAAYRGRLNKLISNQIVSENLDMHVYLSTHSPAALINNRLRQELPSLYFLDIDLGTTINGLELASQLRKIDPSGCIIFITTHDELCHMTFQYKVEAMDFIVKDSPDLLPERIRGCLNYAASKLNGIPEANVEQPSKLHIKIKSKDFYIPYDNIYYIETSTNQHRLILYEKEGSMEFYGNLNSISDQLGPSFARPHRSFLVNQAHIIEVDAKNQTVVLDNGKTCKTRR